MSAAKIVGVIAAVVLTVVPASTQTKPSSSSQIQGVWRIIQTTTSGPNARTIDKSSPDLGGIVIVTGKHFAYVDVTADKPRPPLPQGGAVKAGADELRATWGPFDAQAGTYELKGNESTQRVLVAKAPALMQPGAFYVLSFKVEGDTLLLTQVRNQTGPFANPITYRATRLE